MNKIKDFFRKEIVINIIIIIIFSIFFYVRIFMKNHFLYAMNDDIALRSLASGVYTGTPSFNMIFSAFPFSGILVLLYSITNKLDWYGIILVGSTFFFFSYTVYSIIKQVTKISGKVIVSAVSFYIISILYSFFFVDITFTAVAAFVAICCLVLYFLPNGKIKNIIMACGILLSYGIRPLSCLMVLVFFAPSYLLKNIENKENLKKDFFLGIKIATALLICIIVEKTVITNQSWRDYFEYNKYRSLFYDYYFSSVVSLPEDEKIEIFSSAGLNEDEMKLLCSYQGIAFYEDVPSKMKDLIYQIEAHGIIVNTDVKGTIKQLYDTDIAKYYMFSLLIVLYFALRGKNIKRIAIIFSFFVIQTGLVVYLGTQGRIPDRVVIPMFMAFIISNLCIVFNDAEPRRLLNKTINYDKYLMFILASVLLLIAPNNVKGNADERAVCYRRNVMLRYFDEHPENFYIYDRNSLETFGFKNNYRASNYINMSGWTAYSPAHEEKIKRQGSDSLEELLFKDNVYMVISNSNPDMYRGIDENATIETVDEIDGYYVYKFKR